MCLSEIVLSKMSVSYGLAYTVFYRGENMMGNKPNCLIIPDI